MTLEQKDCLKIPSNRVNHYVGHSFTNPGRCVFTKGEIKLYESFGRLFIDFKLRKSVK